MSPLRPASMPDQPKRKKQCAATIGILERHGLDAALGYLVGEKFASFTKAADHDPSLAADVPAFARAIRSIFTPAQLGAYLQGVKRLGPLGHAATDEQFEELRAAGAVEEDDLDDQLQDLIRVEQMKKLLL